jgi:hypothetical protein
MYGVKEGRHDMHFATRVTGLTGQQWDYIFNTVPVGSRNFPPDVLRVCVVFELDPGTELHVEMELGEFTTTAVMLQIIADHAAMEYVAKAALTPDDDRLPADKECEHRAPVTRQEPSVFDGAEPVRTYSDGCQSYGPYSSDRDA